MTDVARWLAIGGLILGWLGWVAFWVMFCGYKSLVADYRRLECKCAALLRAAEEG